jgi:hypothetical protein
VVSSRILAVPGIRTAPAHGWRSHAAESVGVVIRSPSLWLLGALAFSLRGGILLLLLPMVSPPTMVEARLMLGGNLGSSGLAPSFVAGLAGAGAVLALVVMAGLAALAWAELAADARLRGSTPAPEIRRRVLWRLFAVQLLAFGALVACALPLIAGVARVATAEIVRPSGGGDIYARVAAGVSEPLFFLLGAIVATEIVSAATSRRLLADGSPLMAAFGRAMFELLRRPVRVVATVGLGWLATIAALGLALWSVGMVWAAVRATYLAAPTQLDLAGAIGMATLALVLGGAFIGGLLAAGLASALRAGLWSAASAD